MSDLSQHLIPHGFRFSSGNAGIKPSGKVDFALIVADAPASAAAAFTSNRVIAAPLIVDKENLSASGGRVRVVAINAGNANCAAGEAGLRAVRSRCSGAAPKRFFPRRPGSSEFRCRRGNLSPQCPCWQPHSGATRQASKLPRWPFSQRTR
jgi:N-acetylglutamate synthase/N-acetylornithine aminotransferase